MKAAQAADDVEAMLIAARLNWQLWTIIQAELLAPTCTVPLDIRQNVLSLANFIDKHTVGFIAQPEARKLNVLISINRELAGGLHSAPRDAAPTQAPGEQAPVPPPASRQPTDTSA